MMADEIFKLGVADGMTKEAFTGVLGRMGTSLMKARSRIAGAGARLTRRMGGGAGRFGAAMDRASTALTKRQRALLSAAKARTQGAQKIRNLQTQFKQQASGLAPSKRLKARESLQKQIDDVRSEVQAKTDKALGRKRPPKPATSLRAAPKPDTKPAPKPDTKPAPKPDTKPAPKPDTKPAPKPDTKPAPKPDGVVETATVNAGMNQRTRRLITGAGLLGIGAGIGAVASNLSRGGEQA